MKALILAAGYGTRLGSVTRDIPKPLLPIEGYPLLAYTVAYLRDNGFTQIAINLHFLPEMITSQFGDGDKFGVELTYSHEDTLLGTAGALVKLKPFFSGEDEFLVIYGDLLIDQPLTGLLKQHRRTAAGATLLLHQRQGSNSLVTMAGDRRITGFVERPTDAERQENPFPWVNSGVQVLSSRMLECVPPQNPADLPKDVYMPQINKERIYGYPLTGYRCAIDSPRRYIEAQQAVCEGKYSMPKFFINAANELDA